VDSEKRVTAQSSLGFKLKLNLNPYPYKAKRAGPALTALKLMPPEGWLRYYGRRVVWDFVD
jgi:hypothetical protein